MPHLHRSMTSSGGISIRCEGLLVTEDWSSTVALRETHRVITCLLKSPIRSDTAQRRDFKQHLVTYRLMHNSQHVNLTVTDAAGRTVSL
jgi:hypothetical protein